MAQNPPERKDGKVITQLLHGSACERLCVDSDVQVHVM